MSKKELASLGEAEAEILKIVWELKEAASMEIYQQLPASRRISPGTVQTVLRRLRDKGYLKHRVEGKTHLYSPAIQPEKVITQKVRSFLKSFFGGEPAPLLMHLAREHEIDAEDLDRLQELLKKSPPDKK